jgi:hypothetical protein
MRLKAFGVVLFSWIVCGGVLLWAHHAFESEFDLSKPIHLAGKITQIEWANPHVYVDVAVPSTGREAAIWRVELLSPNAMLLVGVSRIAISLGTAVTVDGFIAKSGAPLVGTSSFAINATGTNVTIPQASWHHSYANNTTTR